MRKNEELKIIQDFYDFMLWMIKHIEKFPRHHRYSLGISLEKRLQKILELFLRAKFSKQKRQMLGDINIELEILRFQLRLAKDLRVLTIKSYGYGSKCLQEIGSQAGGWLKSRE